MYCKGREPLIIALSVRQTCSASDEDTSRLKDPPITYPLAQQEHTVVALHHNLNYELFRERENCRHGGGGGSSMEDHENVKMVRFAFLQRLEVVLVYIHIHCASWCN